MLSKIANAAEGQTLSWQQQKAEMEEHYAQLLAEIHARHQVRTVLCFMDIDMNSHVYNDVMEYIIDIYFGHSPSKTKSETKLRHCYNIE